MSEEGKKSPEKWRKFTKKLEPTIGCLMRAGWIKTFVRDDKGMTIDYTPLGHERMELLAQIQNEIFPGKTTPAQRQGIWPLVCLYDKIPPDEND
jgi:hypothetical protein